MAATVGFDDASIVSIRFHREGVELSPVNLVGSENSVMSAPVRKEEEDEEDEEKL
jgi:hypothetical protein